jgi:hypothetical protein
MSKAEVDIRALKGFVATKFGAHSLLRKVMVVEPDLIPAADLVGKLGTWLAILDQNSEG